MRKQKQKPIGTNTINHKKVDVFLQVPEVLHAWLREEAESGGFKNVQEKILDVLRSTRDSAAVRAA